MRKRLCPGSAPGANPFAHFAKRGLAEQLREICLGMEIHDDGAAEFVCGVIGAGVALATEGWSDAAREVLRPAGALQRAE